MMIEGETQHEIEQITSYFDHLWPVLRSITGEGVRHTHDILGELLPLERIEVPSGTEVFDWVVPKEWVVRDAYLLAPDGSKVLDVWDNNLHLLNYSMPYQGDVSREELEHHLYSLPEQSDAIPYVTSYYEPRWGFCLSHNQRKKLPDGIYHVFIDTEFIDGSLTIGEAVLPGDETQEVLFSTYTCHPSMANNELSGPLVAAFLYRRLAEQKNRRLSYRFVFLPETIGSLSYLSLRGSHLETYLGAGFVVTCLGMDTGFTYKRSRQENSWADRVAEYVLSQEDEATSEILDFFPDAGSDERQYCSPGFDLPVGSLMRGMYGTYPEYHTSLDNRELISFEAIQKSIDVYYEIVRTLEVDRTYKRTMPYGEPNLGKRGLYPTIGTKRQRDVERSAIMWVLNCSDGEHSLLDIAQRSGHDIHVLHEAVRRCVAADLLMQA